MSVAPDTQARPFDLAQSLAGSGKLGLAGLERARLLGDQSGERLEDVLTRLGLVSEGDLAAILSEGLKLPLVQATDYPATPVRSDPLNHHFLRQARVLPLEDRPDSVVLAMANPQDDYTAEAVEFALGKPVQRCVAVPAELDAAFQRLFGETERVADSLDSATQFDDAANDDIDRLKDMASEAPVIRLVNQLINTASERRASDIHLESATDSLRVRYRIDGILTPADTPPQNLRAAIVSRVKIMARLNIAERRLPQDGRIRTSVRGKEIDIRVSTTPTMHGESVVMRLLDRGSVALDFTRLGIDGPALERYRELLDQPHGIVLVTGPTGSGKTTTLYTSLVGLNSADRKILTVEDPIEYQLDGINQTQVKPQIGLTFAGALRSFLRQDPDIMMVGEIRDLETAQIAVQAALTGHLILSTLHTNNAASAITRLLDMGVEDYLLTSTINGLVAQRLVRTLCPHCKQPREAMPELIDRLQLRGLTDATTIVLHHAVGCPACNGTGYLGRSSIIEVLPMSDAIRQLVLQHAEARLIEQAAVAAGMETMYVHGMRKVLAGTTTVEEVLRVTRDR